MKPWLKWIAALVTVLVVVLAFLLVLPFLVDFNRFKPQIQAAVAEKMNAKLDFSSARLTILTGLGVRLEDVVIENTDPDFSGTRLFSVKEVLFRAELVPLLKKRFEGFVLIDRPEIVFATKGLRTNVGNLVKPSDEQAPEPRKEEPKSKGGKAPIDFKKDVVIKAVRVSNAAFTMRDVAETTQEPVRVRDLNLEITNIGLDRDIKVLFSTKADVSQPGVEVHGPVRLDATARVNADVEAARFENATFSAVLNLDELDVNFRNAFVKRAKIPLNLKLAGNTTPTTAKLENLQLTLHTLALALQADVSDTTTLQTNASLKLVSKDIQGLGEVLPQHKALLANASIDLDASAHGAFKNPASVKANLALRALLGGSDLAVDAKVDGIEPPKASVNVVSRKLDVGALLKPFQATPEQKKTAESVAATPAPAAPQGASAEPGLPAEVKKKLEGAQVSLKVDLKEILYGGFRIENFAVDFRQESLMANLDRFALRAMDAALDLNAKANLGLTPPSAQVKLALNAGKINVNEMMKRLGIEPAPKAAEPDATASPVPAPEGATDTPAQEFALTPEQKRLLKGVAADVAVRVAGITHDKTDLDNLVLDAQVADLQAAVRTFSVGGFGGTVTFAGNVNLAAAPISYTAKVGLNDIRVEKLVEFMKPEHKDLLKGATTILLDAKGVGMTKPNIEKNLDAQGTFALKEGEIHTKSVASLAQGEFDAFVGSLSVLAAADGAFKATEKLLENPLAKQAMGQSSFDLAKTKAEYERVKSIKVADKATLDKSLKDVKGTLKIEKGRIHITSKKSGVDGSLDMDASVGLDASLGGGAVYGFSPTLKQRMLAQSKHANLLFDSSGNLDLKMLLGGTVSDPTVKIDFNPVRDRFVKNAQASVEREVKKTVEDFINKSIRGKADAAAAELKRKLAEEAAKRQAELKKAQDEAQAKVNDAKAKAEAEAKKKAAEQKKKTEEAGKKALKNLLGK